MKKLHNTAWKGSTEIYLIQILLQSFGKIKYMTY